MRKALVYVLLLAPLFAQGQKSLKPTTTLALETGNNTSAASAFAGQANGNIAATNISKEPIRSLLYAGATTKIYAHVMPWFGPSNHVTVGYDSASATQAAMQIADMASRGIDGVIVDWYGPTSTHHNTAAQNLLKSAAANGAMEFAINEDYGSVKGSVDPTAKTISDLNYAWQNFMQSPAYMRRDGRPVVFFFGFEGQSADLNVVKAALTFNPLFIMRNAGGFTESMSDGSFGWLDPLTSGYDNYMSLPYVDNFYAKANNHPAQFAVGTGFKGFNDTIAAWAPPGGRHIPQFCGQTWLNSMAEAGKYYSASHQLEALQIVTWNDYEEGTAIEPGIDNCVSVTAWTSGTTLNWAITGDESTVDHYTVFGSADGTNLAPIGDFATGSTSTDLEALNLAPGTYQFYVKAVGKASMTNHMSSNVAYTYEAAAAAPAPADYSMKLSPATVNVRIGGSGQMQLSLASLQGTFSSPVNVSCTGLPAGMSCSFAQNVMTPGSAGTSTTITVRAGSPVASHRSTPLGWQFVPAFGIVAIFGSVRRRRIVQALAVLSLAVIFLMATGCGSASTASSNSVRSTALSAGTYTMTITAASGSISHSTTASVVVQ